ncbi:hypothetical protein ACFLQJ_02760 [Calditrichota bacterium]
MNNPCKAHSESLDRDDDLIIVQALISQAQSEKIIDEAMYISWTQ